MCWPHSKISCLPCGRHYVFFFLRKVMLMKMHLVLALYFIGNGVELSIEALDQVGGIMNLCIYKLIDSKCIWFHLQEIQEFL